MTEWPHRHLKTSALYWKPPTKDVYGDFVWDFPDEIISRWEDSNDVFTNDIGESVSSKAVVYLKDMVLPEGYLWTGKLIDVANDYNPPIDTSSYSDISKISFDLNESVYTSQYSYAMRITQVNRLSLLSDNDVYLYKVYLT